MPASGEGVAIKKKGDEKNREGHDPDPQAPIRYAGPLFGLGGKRSTKHSGERTKNDHDKRLRGTKRARIQSATVRPKTG